MSAPTFDLDSVPEVDRHRVEGLIPDPRLADGYVHRGYLGVDEFDLFDGAVEDAENIMLVGPTGSSKTTVFRAYAASRRLPFALVECNANMDPSMVLGRTTFKEDETVGWVDGDLTLVVRYGGVALIDEINLAHPRVTAAYHGLLAVTRRLSIPEAGESIRAGRGGIGEPQPTLFGAARNDVSYQGAVRLSEALANRYGMPIPWDYDRKVEEQLVPSPRLLDMAYNTRSLAEIRTPLSTNMLQEFVRHFHRWGYPLAQAFFVNHFAPEEQGPVNRAFEAHETAIVAELLGQEPSGDDDTLTGTIGEAVPA